MEEALVFPNECFICKSTGKLIRCRCNLISYCGDEHQRQHWSVHEDFCNAIMSLLEEKGLTHIYEKLFNVLGFDFNKKRVEISRKLIMKLKRPMSLLEQAMFLRPRVCYVCCKVEQKELTNCPGCPIASFCKLHPSNENHSKNCAPMKKYLDFLRTASKLNIDVEFVTRKFGNIFEDLLTFTLQINAEEHVHSRVMKINFHDFLSSASKLHRALHIIYGNVASEIVIYIDCYNFPPIFMKENYWEFLLHYNPRIKMLKIFFIDFKGAPNFKTSLCYNCRVLQKTLQINFISRPNDYGLTECCQKPDVIYCKSNNNLSDYSNSWIKSGCPVILKCDSNMFYSKVSSIKNYPDIYEIIYQGKISSEFSDENEDFIIFKKRDYFNRKQNYKIIQQAMNEYVSLPPPQNVPNSDAKNAQVSEQNKEVIERDSKDKQNSKVQQNPKAEQNPNVENDQKVEQDPNAEDHPKVVEQNLKVVKTGGDGINPKNGKKASNPEEKESASESQGKKLENQVIPVEIESSNIQNNCNAEEIINSEQKLEDLETLSTSSSSSFIVISKSPDPDAKETENFQSDAKKSFESQVDDFNGENVETKISGQKNGESSKSRDDFNENKENEIFLVNHETEKIDKECPVTTCKNYDNENNSKITDSFLLKHNSFLKNENAILRKHLNCSVEEVSELQNKILQLQNVCSTLVKKNKILKEAFSDIDVDIDSALEETIFKI